MQRLTLATVVMMASCGAAAAAMPSGWLTVGEGAFATLKAGGFKMTIRANRNMVANDHAEAVYLVEVDARTVPKIAMLLHRKLRHCGGFMFHDSERDALAALDAPIARAPALTRPSYAINQKAALLPMLARMEEQRLLQTIAHLSSFVNRYYNSEHGARASDWLKQSWSEIAASHGSIVVDQLAHGGYAQRSVVATIQGTDRAAEVVVLGAHLDSINLASDASSARAPGADDDASGVAGLTEVLRAISSSSYRPRRTIKLIAYAAEEVGLRGSQDIARSFRTDKVDVVGVLQLDMTNFKGSSQDIYFISDYTDAAQNQFLAKLVETYLPGTSASSDKCGYACSDHAAWSALGYASSMPFEARLSQDNPHIHSQRDTIANSGNQAAHALKFARLAAAYAVELGSESN